MSDQSEHGPISLIRKIKSGQLNGKDLPKDNRLCCVEYLASEGYSTAELAEILGVSSRTIRRDKGIIREQNAIRLTSNFVPEYIGSLNQKAEHMYNSLLKIARDDTCAPLAKIAALRNAWKTVQELTQCLQSIGYLPNNNIPQLPLLTEEQPDLAGMSTEYMAIIEAMNDSGNTTNNIAEMSNEQKSLITKALAIEATEVAKPHEEEDNDET